MGWEERDPDWSEGGALPFISSLLTAVVWTRFSLRCWLGGAEVSEPSDYQLAIWRRTT
jgi:hypothetical protein